jgi:hypothetical protein
MAEKKSSKSLHGFWEWLQQPNSWLSLSAAILSIITFYLVQANPGTLEVVLPANVGLRLRGDGLELLVPMTLTNTGAPRNHRHVITMVAFLQQKEKPVVPLRWESEWTFLGYLEFNRKYPGHKEGEHQDYIDYVSRAVPFVLVGGQSLTKLIKFTSRAGVINNNRSNRFELKVVVKTEHKEFAQTATFMCAAEISQQRFDWCERI